MKITLSHWEQTKGLSPVCVRLWTTKLLLWANRCRHLIYKFRLIKKWSEREKIYGLIYPVTNVALILFLPCVDLHVVLKIAHIIKYLKFHNLTNYKKFKKVSLLNENNLCTVVARKRVSSLVGALHVIIQNTVCWKRLKGDWKAIKNEY
jgi:hypothetical protein